MACRSRQGLEAWWELYTLEMNFGRQSRCVYRLPLLVSSFLRSCGNSSFWFAQALCFAWFLGLLAAWQVYRLCTQCLPRDWVLQEWCHQCIVSQLQCIHSMDLCDLSDWCHSRETRTLRVDVEALLDLTSLLGATIQGMPPPGWLQNHFHWSSPSPTSHSKHLNRQLIHRQRNRNCLFVALYSSDMWVNSLEQPLLFFLLNYSKCFGGASWSCWHWPCQARYGSNDGNDAAR